MVVVVVAAVVLPVQDITVAVHASLAFESPVFGIDEVRPIVLFMYFVELCRRRRGDGAGPRSCDVRPASTSPLCTPVADVLGSHSEPSPSSVAAGFRCCRLTVREMNISGR